jgi:hypothetical protein
MQAKKLIVPLLCPDFVVTLGPYVRKSFGMYGGDDGARTRDLCRDRYLNSERIAGAHYDF